MSISQNDLKNIPAWRLFVLLVILQFISGCMVGPSFHSPTVPRVKTYLEKPLPKKTVSTPHVGKAGSAQQFVHGQEIPATWWQLFHSKALNELITLGINRNRSLSASYAALRAAQEAVNVQVGTSLLPAVDLNLGGSRSKALNEGIFNVFNANVSVSYVFDVFGGARRQIENLRAQVDDQQFQLIAAYVTLSTNITTTAITIASLQAQIAVTQELLAAQQDQLTILEKQFDLGGIAKDIVLTQETLVNQTRASLPPLEKNLAQQRHALSVLTGGFPNEQLPLLRLDDLNLPTNLPVSFPSRLVRQRPDVRSAEALLHAANASIGVATANLFPQFAITGSYGWQASTPSTLFKSATTAWSYGGNMLQPLFQGGALLASRRQAIALRDQAYFQYQQVVLQAFQNVADVLRALEVDAKLLQTNRLAEQSAAENLKITQQQYRLGGTSYLALLNAQEQYQTQRIAVIQAKAARYIDTAALFQALGGGWWHQKWCVDETLFPRGRS